MIPISTLLALDGPMTGFEYEYLISPMFTSFLDVHQTEFVDYTAPRTVTIEHNYLSLYGTLIL